MKKFVSFVLVLMVVFGTVFSTAVVSNAASISSNKHTATGINGGQTVYIKSNTGWNTELFGNTYRTKIQIRVPVDENGLAKYGEFQYTLRDTAQYAKVDVTIYKKSGSSWVKQNNLSGSFNCTRNGYLCTTSGTAKTWVLPGKGVEYKVVIAPKINWLTEDWLGFDSVSDMKGFTLKITSYGTITKVA